MSCRRLAPGQSIRSAAASAAALARAMSGPLADHGQHPSAVRLPGAVGRSAGARVEDQRPGRAGVVDPARSVRRRSAAAGSRRRRSRPRPWPSGASGRSGRRPRAVVAASRRSPFAAASSNGPSATPSRGRITCVSGSPNRALNSSSRGPSAVSINPAYRAPRNGRASPRELARAPVDGSRSTMSEEHLVREIAAAGCRRPCRRCSVPGRRRAPACGPSRRAGRSPSGRRTGR